MTQFFVLFSILVACVFSYETINSPMTAFSSCQDVLTRDPLAVDGYYYINNFGTVEPYLTLCIMSVNSGGWTLFYKNSAIEEEGSSYVSMLENPEGFLSETTDFLDPDVVGVSPVSGLHPVSLMAMVVGDDSNRFSAVYFNNEDAAESVIGLTDLIVGCNTYEQQFSLVETFSCRSCLTRRGKPDFTFSEFGFADGSISFRSCDTENEFSPSDVWLGDVFSMNLTRVISCGGLEGTHCAYFVREVVDLNGPSDECMCRAAGGNNMVWPATRCGETRVISCFEDVDEGSLSRVCGENGIWSDYIEGNCTCSETTEFDTVWPSTRGGETAHVACVNDGVKTRDRLCLMNGEWDDMMTGGCSCLAGEYQGVRWEETEGGNYAEHVCDVGAEGTPYLRFCNKDGGWSFTVEGGCSCPETFASGVTWDAVGPLTTQTVMCNANSVGESMQRTCSIYGSWEPIQGNCDCPEENLDGVIWPQTTSGVTAYVSCAPGAVGTPSSRICYPTGYWGFVVEGACSCPEEDWQNYAGTHYTFPETAAGQTVMMECANGLEGMITRHCGLFGVWEEPLGCHEDVYCPEETIGLLHFNETLGGTTVMYMCKGDSSMSYGRLCRENGVWDSLIGYCECPEEVDAQGNLWPRTRGNETYEQECDSGYSGKVSRGCSFFGEWYEIENTCVRYMCPAEVVNGLEWPETPSLTTATHSCEGTGVGLQRFCNAMGTWEEVTGSCSCVSEELDGILFPELPAGEEFSFACAQEGYMGARTRRCGILGAWEEIVDGCYPLSCPPEEYEGVDWPLTIAGTYASVNCTSSSEGYSERFCRIDGQWASRVRGPGCSCDEVVVEENGLYVFPPTPHGETVTFSCAVMYSGTISYTCTRSGEWTNLVNECERLICPGETIGGLYFPPALSNTTQFVSCAEGGVGTGYSRFCSENGRWEDSYSGSCSCPAEEVRHTDGHLYNFDETSGGDVVSQVCGGDLAGSVSRVCSLIGGWQPIRGECQQLQCPEETLDNYHWPLTNSSTLQTLPCNDYRSGNVTRYCHAAGVWEDPVENCRERECTGVTINPLGNGCMNVLFTPDSSTPYVKLDVVPSTSPDFSVVFRGRTARICGLEANVAYSMFVQYCTDEDLSVCTSSCMKSDVYYQQTCDIMSAIDIINVVTGEDTAITFSSRFPSCPGEPSFLEVTYRCVEQCGDTPIEETRQFACTSLNGCVAGQRGEFTITADFPTDALFEVQQRMQFVSDFSGLQQYSPIRSFRVRDLLRPSYLSPTVEYINSQTVRLNLGNIAEGNVAYSKHVIYIYKMLTGTRRRLVDSLFSTVTLCPLGNTVCEETYTDVVVEPGYTFTFSIYSTMMVGNRRIVSIASIDVDLVPYFTLTPYPGDSFIRLVLANAKYDLSGTCSFISQSTSTQTLVEVSLPKQETVRVLGTNLVINSNYVVTCALHDELGLENRQTVSVSTVDVIEPTLTLEVLKDTIYDVQVSATVNKPVSLYCQVSTLDVIPSVQELIMYGTYFDVTEEQYEVNLLLPQSFETTYRVTCAAVDVYNRAAHATIEVTPSGTVYVPELVSVYPELDATNVPPLVSMQLTFKYPVRVTECQFCFFILYDMTNHESTNLYSSSFSIVGNSIVFATRQFSSLTQYRLTPSTRGLIVDAANGAVFEPEDDTLLQFTVREYTETDGEVINPPVGSFFPVNGVIEVEFNTYLFLNEGSLTLNTLSVAADNMCLQIKHNSETSTTLLIPVEDCVGLLRSDSSYVMVLPQGLLRTRDFMYSPRITHVFQTESQSYAPQMIGSFPPHLEEVPVDVPVRLYFNQPVMAGDGFLFVSEYDNGQYVNSYNLPASKATFSDSFPYEVSWNAYLFSLKPTRRYVISWSEGLVVNYYGQRISASSAAETVEFWTDVSPCSADFIADKISGTLQCVYDNGKCVCREWNVEAMTQKQS